MTIDRYHGKLFAMCDECGAEFVDNRGKTRRYDSEDFDVLIADLKEEEWRTEVDSKGPKKIYTHYCPDC